MSERDERVSEPPQLQGELDRWQQSVYDAMLWWAVDEKGELHFGDSTGWRRSVTSDDECTPGGVARRRLAAELAACRARRDGGDGEAWRLLIGAAEQAAVDLDALVSDCAGMKANEHERYLRLRQQVRITKALAAKCGDLLARRATATTATPTKE